VLFLYPGYYGGIFYPLGHQSISTSGPVKLLQLRY